MRGGGERSKGEGGRERSKGEGGEGEREELVVMEDGRRRRAELKIRLRVWLAKLIGHLYNLIQS